MSRAVDVSVDQDGEWKGRCLYAYESEGWTVFEDLTGGYSAVPAADWLEFAQNDDLVVAGYNDAISYAELVMITGGAVQKDFLQDAGNPGENRDTGDIPPDVHSWEDAASFADDDALVFSEHGTVLIL